MPPAPDQRRADTYILYTIRRGLSRDFVCFLAYSGDFFVTVRPESEENAGELLSRSSPDPSRTSRHLLHEPERQTHRGKRRVQDHIAAVGFDWHTARGCKGRSPLQRRKSWLKCTKSCCRKYAGEAKRRFCLNFQKALVYLRKMR